MKRTKFICQLILLSLVLPFMAAPVNSAPRLVASIKPLQLIAQAILGDIAQAEVLLPSYADPHNFALKPSDLVRLKEADLVIWVGPDFEYYLAKPLTGATESNKVITISALLGERLADKRDPHIWLSPGYAVRIASEIAWRLAKIDFANAAQYQRNLSVFLENLQQADERLVQMLEPLRSAPYLVYHDAYYYFERDYGLKSVGAIHLNNEIKPGAKHLLNLRTLVREKQVKCLFTEPGARQAVIDVVLNGAPVEVRELDPLASNIPVSVTGYLDYIADLAARMALCLASAQGSEPA